MKALAITATIAALILSIFIFFANGWAPIGSKFVGMEWIVLAWVVVLVCWLAWWFK
jgi:hypothetical protein